MIIKFKNGYTVRVNDSENRDTKDVIKRAYLLTEEIRINDDEKKENYASAKLYLQSVRKNHISLKEANKRLANLGYKIIENPADPSDPYRLRGLEEEDFKFNPLPQDYLIKSIGGVTYDKAEELYQLGQQKDKTKKQINKIESNVIVDSLNFIHEKVFNGLKKIKRDCEKFYIAALDKGGVKRPVYNIKAISPDEVNEFYRIMSRVMDAYTALSYTHDHMFGKEAEGEFNRILEEANNNLEEVVRQIRG